MAVVLQAEDKPFGGEFGVIVAAQTGPFKTDTS